MSRLQGQVVVLTGGGSGVGRSAAGLLVQAGANVVVAGRDPAKLDATLAEINAPAQTLAVPTDVTDPEQCQKLIEATNQRFGPVSILVNNAGTNIKQRSFRDITAEAWDKMIRANLDGAFYCTKAVLPQMLEQKNGLVVNVVSVAGKRANPLGGVAYVAAKFGMGAMGLVLSNEEKDSGIRVSNIYPGEIDTPILSERPVPITEAHRATILQPADVAEAILFVCSLPSRVSIPELVIKPSTQGYW
jgi:NADP-dependent 3-hydroxy acid dehydrogenase YdfG